MKRCQYIFTLVFFAVAFNAYSSGETERRETSAVGELDITARGSIGQAEILASTPMYAGNGGENIRLAILAPEIQGNVPEYLPLYIQGLLNNNFNKYSAINIIDRQNLNRIIAEQNIAASGRFSDRDFVNIGDLTNAQYFLFGIIQKLSGNRFSLQLSVTEARTGLRRATFMKDGTIEQLEGRAALLNEATAELLSQLGIQLTEAGRLSLLTGNTSVVQAEAGLARGIAAQAGGADVEALFNFAQAIIFAPSQLEALSRLNTLSTTISGGTISQRIVNDIQARDQWILAFKEAARFFNSHPPFEIIFDPNLIQIGETDFAKRTATLGMRIALDASEAGFNVLNSLLEGLEKTGRRSAWGFSGWPLLDISPPIREAVVFNGRRSFSYKVDVALINENGVTLGNSSITLNTGQLNFVSGDKSLTPTDSVFGTVRFNNVKAEDLTPVLTILIVAVNGTSSAELAASGYMKIETGDLETRMGERETEVISAQRQREQEQQRRQQEQEQQRQREAAQRQAEAAVRNKNAEKNFLGFSFFYQIGTNNPGLWGVGASFSITPFPYVSVGIDVKLGVMDDNASSGNTGNDSPETLFTAAPDIGFVFPLSDSFRVFSDLAIEMGRFSPFMKGIIADWATPSISAGIIFNMMSLRFFAKYELAWYNYLLGASDDIRATHSFSVGYGLITW
jgi:hypothetical protein